MLWNIPDFSRFIFYQVIRNTVRYFLEMGAYLTLPVREKESRDFDGDFLSFGASSMQGWRMTQEVSIVIAVFGYVLLPQTV